MNMDYTKIENIKQKLKQTLPERTYLHTLRTVDKAMELCKQTDADADVVFMAALLHDCAKKDVPTEQQLVKFADFADFSKVIHAPLGADKARREFGITDKKIIDCIFYHTTGKAKMSIEEMIVFLADAIEDGRDYPGLEEIREEAKLSIKAGVLQSLENVVKFESANGNKLHHLTLEAIKDLKGEF